MKQLIKSMALRLGFKISRVSSGIPHPDPFCEMKRLLQGVDQPIIFDVGAHHGESVDEFRSLFPQSLIYSFEPFNESYFQLRHHTESDPLTSTFNFGLSNEDSLQKFFSNSSSATNSLLSTDTKGGETWDEGMLDTKEIIELEFRTLDSILNENDINHINILKLDVQGAEHLVIEGGKLAIKERKIDIIYSEIIIQPTYNNQKRLDEAFKIFYDCGYDLHNIYNCSLTKNGKLRQIDAIFTCSNY